MADDAKASVDGGYTPDFLAFKHGISVKEAIELIKHVGQNRNALDKAASRLRATALRRPK
ncbi:DUF3606 domain-containing protein [Tardiphaga sp.]|jgi:hypothetical protein|uniref:DUF3606 domain-containing protein n=1 Tax=Tardiphaga sp. TaxID=1926292 RepID=UPI0037DA209C